jgi:hypothetical protein
MLSHLIDGAVLTIREAAYADPVASQRIPSHLVVKVAHARPPLDGTLTADTSGRPSHRPDS